MSTFYFAAHADHATEIRCHYDPALQLIAQWGVDFKTVPGDRDDGLHTVGRYVCLVVDIEFTNIEQAHDVRRKLAATV